MNFPRRLSAIAAAALMTLGACGSEDDTADESPADTTAAVSEAPASDGTDAPADDPAGSGDVAAPTATMPEGLPEEAYEAFSPVDVAGEPLREFADGGDDPAVGATAPVLTGYDIDGDVVRVDAAEQGPTALVFVAHWCPHCNAEVPAIMDWYEAGVFDGVNVVAVATGSNPDSPNFPPQEWLRSDEMGWTLGTLVDGVVDNGKQLELAAMTAFGGAGFPYVVLVDGDGNVTQRWAGERDEAFWTEALAAIT